MKTKSLSFIIAGIFAFVFLIGLTSAFTFSTQDNLDNYIGDHSFEVTVENTTASEPITLYFSDISDGSNTISFEVIDLYDVSEGGLQSLTVNYTVHSSFDFNFPKEDYSTTLTVSNGNTSEDESKKISLRNDFCEYEDFNYLDVEISDWKVVSGYGNDDEWFPLDTIEIELTIENPSNYDLQDVKVEWGLYDEENEDWAIKVDDEDKFDLDSDEDEVITFTFKLDDGLDLDHFKDLLDSDSLKLYARATGDVDDKDSSHDNERTCVSADEDFNVIIEKDFTIIYDLEMPESLSCDSTLQISGEVWNIGEKDQDNVEVKIVIPDFDIVEYLQIGDLNNDFDKTSFNINIEIPEDAKTGSHSVKFYVLDEDGDTYEADNDDELSSFSRSIIVTGDCSVGKVAVSATLQSGGKSGEDLVIEATIVNSGSKTSEYLLNAAGYSEWATSADLSRSSVTVEPGQSQKVLITLKVNKEAEGDKLFNLEVLSDNKLVASQPVSVTVEKSSLFGLTGFSINRDNWHIWGIGFLNLILVIVIIFVAVKIARRK